MSKWINSKVNEFLGTTLTVRETEILMLGTMCTGLVALIFVMYTAIFPNIWGVKMLSKTTINNLIANSNAITDGQKKPLPAPTDNDQYKYTFPGEL